MSAHEAGASRLAVLACLAALGCAVPDLDLAGRPCPCAAGWVCDEASHTCLRPGDAGGGGREGGTTDAGRMDAAGDTGTPDAAGGDAGALIFEDDFDGDLSRWVFGGGTWTIEAGEARQIDPEATHSSLMYVRAFTSLSDYRMVVRMRQISGVTGGAMEVDFRVDGSMTSDQYFCNWEPNSGKLLIMIGGASAGDLVMRTLDLGTLPSYDAFGSFTMEIEVQGDRFHCWLHEIPEADITVRDATFASGSFGFKTYRMATAYDFIRVYALP